MNIVNNVKKFDISILLFLTICLIFILPVLVILGSLFAPFTEGFYHILNTVLNKYIINSIFLVIGVCIIAGLIGVISAYIIAFYDFYGKKYFQYLLILPLAIPPYVAAFIYGGIFEFAGPVQSFIREFFSYSKGDYYFFEIRSVGGAIFVFSIVLYPYIYMMCLAAFKKSINMFEVGRTLSLKGYKLFAKIMVPIIRPAIIGSSLIIIMEVLSDFGAAQHFAIDSFTTGIYRAWFGMNDYVAAGKLSAYLLLFIITIILVERKIRGNKNYTQVNESYKYRAIKLSGMQGNWAFIFCSIIVFFALILPIFQLIIWFLDSYKHIINAKFLSYIGNSLYISLLSALFTLLIALLFAYIRRFEDNKYYNSLINISLMGYAIPGSVIAVGLLVIFGYLNNHMLPQYLLSNSIVGLLFAYNVRFLPISYNAIDAGMSKINKEIDYAATMLGKSKADSMINIHIPMLKTSLLTAFLLVFIESMKELPATLIIRPFNFETLATYTYQLASDERLADSACSALIIVILSLISIFVCFKRY